MAYGIPCKHCGRQETEHFHPEYDEHPSKKYKGYSYTLKSCRGYAAAWEPSSPSSFEIAWLEKEARGNAAWGQYSAVVRDAAFKKKLKDLNNNIRMSKNQQERTEALKAKEHYLAQCRSHNVICIGHGIGESSFAHS